VVCLATHAPVLCNVARCYDISEELHHELCLQARNPKRLSVTQVPRILLTDGLVPGRADEVEIEDQVRRRSATGDAMGAKTLCIPLEQPELPPGTKCFVSGKPAKNWALWGRSY
jgi:hypothetical protein